MSYNRRPTDIHSLPRLNTFRTKLRSNLTPAEAALWKMIQASKLEGRKFRRQHSVGTYIVDFYCPSEKLAIELDGEVHFNERVAMYDYERKLFLEYFGIRVIRIENKWVFEETVLVLDRIRSNFGWREK